MHLLTQYSWKNKKENNSEYWIYFYLPFVTSLYFSSPLRPVLSFCSFFTSASFFLSPIYSPKLSWFSYSIFSFKVSLSLLLLLTYSFYFMPSCLTVLIFAICSSLWWKWALKFAIVHWALYNYALITLLILSKITFILLFL